MLFRNIYYVYTSRLGWSAASHELSESAKLLASTLLLLLLLLDDSKQVCMYLIRKDPV